MGINWATVFEDSEDSGVNPTIAENASKELTTYMKMNRIAVKVNPLNFWKEHREELKNLASFAKIYLSTLPSSTASEREFKFGENIQKDWLRLTPENTETLLFLKYNLRATDHNMNLTTSPSDIIPPYTDWAERDTVEHSL